MNAIAWMVAQDARPLHRPIPLPQTAATLLWSTVIDLRPYAAAIDSLRWPPDLDVIRGWLAEADAYITDDGVLRSAENEGPAVPLARGVELAGLLRE